MVFHMMKENDREDDNLLLALADWKIRNKRMQLNVRKAGGSRRRRSEIITRKNLLVLSIVRDSPQAIRQCFRCSRAFVLRRFEEITAHDYAS